MSAICHMLREDRPIIHVRNKKGSCVPITLSKAYERRSTSLTASTTPASVSRVKFSSLQKRRRSIEMENYKW